MKNYRINKYLTFLFLIFNSTLVHAQTPNSRQYQLLEVKENAGAQAQSVRYRHDGLSFAISDANKPREGLRLIVKNQKGRVLMDGKISDMCFCIIQIKFLKTNDAQDPLLIAIDPFKKFYSVQGEKIIELGSLDVTMLPDAKGESNAMDFYSHLIAKTDGKNFTFNFSAPKVRLNNSKGPKGEIVAGEVVAGETLKYVYENGELKRL